MSLEDGTHRASFEPSSQVFAVESTEKPSNGKDKNELSLPFEIVSKMSGGDESDRAIGLGELLAFLKQSKSGINNQHNFYEATALHVAAEYGLLDAARVLISFGAKLSVQDRSGREPLHIACLEGDKAMAELFINHGANIEARQSQGATPLDEACWRGHGDIVKLLIDKGAEVLVEDKSGWSPLCSASYGGDETAVQLLLDKDKSNIDKPENMSGYTPLLAAITGGNEEIALLLVQMGAKYNVSDKDGSTALHLSISNSQLEVMLCILEKDKSNIDKPEPRSGVIPLLAAITGGNEKVALALLEMGANYDISDKDKSTALHLSISSGQLRVAFMLLKKGAKINNKDKLGRTELHLSILFNHSKLALALLDQHADISLRDNSEWTVLHFAHRSVDTDLAKFLLNKGPKDLIDCIDDQGSTALHSASMYGNESMVQLLLQNKAKPGVTDKDRNTPLHVAVIAVDRDDSRSESDEETDSQSSKSKASLDARYTQQAAVVRLLLEGGAEPEAQNHDNKSAIDLIMAHAEPTMFQVLLKHFSQPRKNKELPTSSDLFAANLLIREKFEDRLLLLIRRSPRSHETQETLNLALITILDLLKIWYEKNLNVQLPSVLCSLITASRRTKDLDEKLKLGLSSIKDLIAKYEAQALNRNKPDQSAPQAQEMPPNTKRIDDNKEMANPKMEGKASKQKDGESPVLEKLYFVRDILRDPPFAQQHRDDPSKFRKPVTEKRLEPILKEFEATVVQFYKDGGESAAIRRYRTVKEMIYGNGPIEIMSKAMKDLETMRTKQRVPLSDILSSTKKPRFTWVHLPVTNVSELGRENLSTTNSEIDGLDEYLLMGITKEEKANSEEYFELKSFFQDSWIEVPDKTVPSRMMKPRTLIRHMKTANRGDAGDDSNSKSNFESQDDSPSREAAPGTATPERSKASALYMPYFCFSRSCSEDVNPRRRQNQNKYTDDQMILNQLMEDIRVLLAISGSSPAEGHKASFQGGEVEGDRDHQKLRDYCELLELYDGSAIHRSPTLDEWYYHFVEGGEAEDERIKRNKEQVVTKFLHPEMRESGNGRNTRKSNVAQQDNREVRDGELHSQQPWTLLRINQIWIWSFENKWIITASSCSLDDTNDSLVEGILDQLNKQAEHGGNESQPESAEAMTKVIIDYCVGSYERKPRQGEENEQGATMSIGQIFSNYMNKIGRDETELYDVLCQWASNENLPRKAMRETNSNQNPPPERDHGAISNKTKPEEWTAEKMRESFERTERLFRDIKDVRDELNILKSVVRFQKTVQKDLAGNHAKDTNVSADYIENDIKGMEDVADRIKTALNATLSLQQSEIANKQTEISMSQNTVLMTFTLATVLFLPLSFLSSLFALDIESFQQAPQWAFYVIFFGSLGVSLIILLGAWNASYIYKVWDQSKTSIQNWKKGAPCASEDEDDRKPDKKITKNENVAKYAAEISERDGRISIWNPLQHLRHRKSQAGKSMA